MRIFYGCIFLLLYACGNKAAPGIGYRNEVVIITDPAPDQSVGKMIIQGLASTFTKDCITYLDSSRNETSYTPNRLNPDTLIILALTKVAEIRHQFKGHEMVRYAFFAGDTVSISYDSTGRPWARSQTNKVYTQLYNLPYTIPGAIVPQSGYSVARTLLNDYYHMAYRIIKGNNIADKPFFDKCKQAYINLDSLLAEYRSYRTLLRNKLNEIAARDTSYTPLIKFYFHRLYSDSLQVFTRFGLIRIQASDITYDDALLNSISYRENIQGAAYQFYCNENNKVNPLVGFDKIAADSSLPPGTKQVMLKRVLDIITYGLPMLYTSSSVETIKYQNKYTMLTGDTSVIFRSSPKSNASKEMRLVNISGEKTSYSQLLSQLKGHVIYVDFWASWCAPCIDLLPAVHRLEQTYQKEKFIIISLAYNDKKSDWQNSLKRFNLNPKTHFFIENPDNATFLSEIQLSHIPRFLLYDKSGNLVDINAPRPSSKNIKKEIDKLLTEKP